MNDDIDTEKKIYDSELTVSITFTGAYYLSAGSYTANPDRDASGAYALTVNLAGTTTPPPTDPDPGTDPDPTPDPGSDSTITGTNSAETLNGTNRGETIRGLGGSDTLIGRGGNDTLDGGDGDDMLSGKEGADVLIGGNGADTASYAGSPAGVTVRLHAPSAAGGHAQGDTFGRMITWTYTDQGRTVSVQTPDIAHLTGSDEDDVLAGDVRANVLRGGKGDDKLYGGPGGNETNRDSLYGDAGNDKVYGGRGNDSLYGGAGDDGLHGGDHNDELYGDAGADSLDGGPGDDKLHGGEGNDALTGGNGSDTFIFGYDGGSDIIKDFSTTDDRIDLAHFNLTGINDSNLDISKSGSDTVITVDNDVAITLEGVTTTLVGNDFIFRNAVMTLHELVDANGVTRADAPANPETQHTMAVGDDFLGNLADPDDQDWIRIELQPGATYIIRLHGHGEAPLNDPLLELYDAEGQRVAFNDDMYEGVLHSQMVFTVPESDRADAPATYYINARSYSLNPALRSDDDYRLSVREQLPLAAPATPPAAPEALLNPETVLTGLSVADELTGDDGDNVLDGGRGADILDGGGQPADGLGDSASYRRAGSGVTVNLLTGRGEGDEAEGDVLIDIENLIGSDYDDTLSGDNRDNILLGGAGDDTLAGGGGGDLLLGGPGTDTVTYERNFSNHGVRVDLAAGVADGSTAEGDRLAGIREPHRLVAGRQAVRG